MTNAPRTRNGAKYPGGKHLRKALEALNSRNNGTNSGKLPDHGYATWPNGSGVTKAGSMKS